MKLEDQVCTLEQAKRLQELGISQQAYFSWAYRVKKVEEVFNGETTEWVETEHDADPTLIESGIAVFDGLPHYAAFTVAELGVMLPKHIPHSHYEGGEYYYMQGHCSSPEQEIGNPIIWYEDNDCFSPNDKLCLTSGVSEASARASMLIHLLGIGLLSVNEVNERLIT